MPPFLQDCYFSILMKKFLFNYKRPFLGYSEWIFHCALIKGTVKVKVAQSCPTLWGLYSPRGSPVQNTGMNSFSLLQGIFPTLGSNPGLPHFRLTLYQMSHKGSPRILEWVAYPFSSRSSQPRNWTRVSWIEGRFFTNWAIREAYY